MGGPYSYAKGPSRASLQKIYTCGHLDGHHLRTCAPRIVTDFARRAFRRPVTTREVEKYITLVQTAQKEERASDVERVAERAGRRDPGDSGLAGLPLPPRARSPAHGDRRRRTGSRRTSSRRACRTSSGRACRTRSCGARPTPARCAIRKSSRSRCGACCAIRRPTRSPRTSAGSGCSSAPSSRSRAIATSFPSSRTTSSSRCGARPSSSSRPSSGNDRSVLDFINGRYSFLNERLARHYGIPDVVGTGVPAGRSHGHAARRRAHAGKHPRGLVVRHAHVSGAARQMGARQPAQRAATRAAGRCPEPRRGERSAPPPRCANSSKSTGRTRFARPATAAWTRSASASRTSTPSARGEPWRASFRSTRRASCPTGARSKAPTSCATSCRPTARRSRAPSRRSC